MNLQEDIRLAQNVRRNSYIDNTNLTVGVVLKTKSGRKYTGCNIEVSNSKIIWAEAVAIQKAISEGEREFEYMLIMAGNKNELPEKYLPCKDCKQFIRKFVDEKFKIYIVYESKIEEYKFVEI